MDTGKIIKTLLTLAASGSLLLNTAVAQTAKSHYPSRPISFITGFPPGGSTDLVTRIVAAQMSEVLGQPVVVENRPGASGSIASQYVSRSAPDGYTIYLGTLTTHGINPVLQTLPFDHINDFTMISQLGFYTNLVLVKADNPAKTLGEWIQQARQSSRPMNFGSPGVGTSGHLTGEYFKMLTDVPLNHIPYKGSAAALADLVGGQIDVMFDNLPSALGLVQSGKLRALAITSRERVAQLPDVPTLTQAGVPEMIVDAWVGVMAPGRLAQPVLEKLHQAILMSVDAPQVRSKLTERGVTVRTQSPAEFLAYIQAENEKWANVVKISGAQAN